MLYLLLQAKPCKKCKSTGSITCPGCKVSKLNGYHAESSIQAARPVPLAIFSV